jgi:ankyrin repeat protein
MTLENATLLHLAALSGHQEIVKYLLIRKIALDVPANYILRDHPVKQYLMKSTALHFALFSSEFEIAELILTSGADPTLKMDFTYENSDFTEFNEAQKGINALHCAALWNDRETMDMILSYNSSLELVKTDDGKTYFDLANNEDESEEDVYDEFNHDSDEDL